MQAGKRRIALYVKTQAVSVQNGVCPHVENQSNDVVNFFGFDYRNLFQS